MFKEMPKVLSPTKLILVSQPSQTSQSLSVTPHPPTTPFHFYTLPFSLYSSCLLSLLPLISPLSYRGSLWHRTVSSLSLSLIWFQLNALFPSYNTHPYHPLTLHTLSTYSPDTLFLYPHATPFLVLYQTLTSSASYHSPS